MIPCGGTSGKTRPAASWLVMFALPPVSLKAVNTIEAFGRVRVTRSLSVTSPSFWAETKKFAVFNPLSGMFRVCLTPTGL